MDLHRAGKLSALGFVHFLFFTIQTKQVKLDNVYIILSFLGRDTNRDFRQVIQDYQEALRTLEEKEDHEEEEEAVYVVKY